MKKSNKKKTQKKAILRRSAEKEEEQILEQLYQEKLNLHKKAELYESRINDGKEGYEELHPAKCAAMAVHSKSDEQNDHKMDESEDERFNNYQSIIPETRIPSFWQKRIWDDQTRKMTKEEETKLLGKLSLWKEVPSKDDFTFNNRKPSALCPHVETPYTEGRKSYRHSIRFSRKYMLYQTDDSDTDEELLLE